MRSVTLARSSSVIGAVAGLALASWAGAAQDVKGSGPAAAPPAAVTQEVPELRPGEIMIKRTGHTKRVVTVSRQTPGAASQPPAPGATPVRVEAAENYDKPGPRSVEIGYLVRDPMEMGMGPQLNEGASPFLPNNSYGGYYGYNSCLPSYGLGSYGGFGYGAGCRTYGGGIGSYRGVGCYGSYGSFGSFGGRSSFNPAAGPVTHATRAR